jgi:hypothetical protein
VAEVWNASGVEVPFFRVGRTGTKAMKAGNGRRGGGFNGLVNRLIMAG